MQKNIFFVLILICSSFLFSYSQNLNQTIRGVILDKESKAPLIGATVSVWRDSIILGGSASDVSGNFRINNIPVGRNKIKVSYIGYRELIISNVIVSSAKETIINPELEESALDIKEITISAKKNKTNNEMSVVSTHSFVTEETERYAGSRGDPARMSSNFAGVQGADDSRNDIVIRGNSPLGLLWRMEGVDMINPNHFAVAGTTGGPVSILNNKVLGNSDFFTGAFPAEYGNAIGGVFDLRMRNGNNEKHEFTAQLGALGMEAGAEGPLSKKNASSYLINFRYSTLALFSYLGINYGTAAVPKYGDGSFKLNFPTKKAGNFSLFGIGGMSDIDIKVSDFKKPEDDLYAETDRDQYFNSSMGMLGLSHTKPINTSTYTKFTVTYSLQKINASSQLVYRDSLNFSKIDSLVDKLGTTFITGKTSVAFSLNKKFSAKNSIKTGWVADLLNFNYIDSNYNTIAYRWSKWLDYKGTVFLIQPYIQWKYKLNDQWEMNSGLHAQLFTLNNSFSIEPRLGIRWQFQPNQSINFGYGMHSQMQPYYIYFHQIQSYTSAQGKNIYLQPNKNLDLTHSQHFVAGYNHSLGNNSRFLIETYFQLLSKVPVDSVVSSYSVLNEGADYNRFFPKKLVNKGTGTNYGVEFTHEKFFSENYYFLTTLSFYESKYKGSDGKERNTNFNGNFVYNLLAGKEFNLGKKMNTVLTTGTKVTWAGSGRYTEIDINATRFNPDKNMDVIIIDSLRNEKKFRNYFRVDLKIGLKMNRNKTTHEIAVDLVNLFNTKNVFTLNYSYKDNKLKEQYQLGFLPLFYYRIDF